jgi:hypothetical protein
MKDLPQDWIKHTTTEGFENFPTEIQRLVIGVYNTQVTLLECFWQLYQGLDGDTGDAEMFKEFAANCMREIAMTYDFIRQTKEKSA